MKVSVIMPSFLGEYPGAAKNRDKKFIRAVNSFLNQTYEDKELIIVCDGCTKTYELYMQNFATCDNIKITMIPKQPHYSGEMRNEGLKMADGDMICYLDSDDIIGVKHIETIVKQFNFEDTDIVYYDDYLVLDAEFKKFQVRSVEPRYASIGTSSIAHKNFWKMGTETFDSLFWQTGYGHDFFYWMKLISRGYIFRKITEKPTYIVCHYSGGDF